jgi:hypothetical protein
MVNSFISLTGLNAICKYVPVIYKDCKFILSGADEQIVIETVGMLLKKFKAGIYFGRNTE